MEGPLKSGDHRDVRHSCVEIVRGLPELSDQLGIETLLSDAGFRSVWICFDQILAAFSKTADGRKGIFHKLHV